MPNSAGLSWYGTDRIVFSEIMDGTVVHMGIKTARENRTDEHEVYFPSHERGMAHYSYPSPDQHSILLVEMDRQGAWQLLPRGSDGREFRRKRRWVRKESVQPAALVAG